MNLLEKLLEIRKAVPPLPKDGELSIGKMNYDYVSSSAILRSIREEMDKHGVLLLPEVVSAQGESGEKGIFTQIHMKWTWIDVNNPEDRISIPWYAQGRDAMEMGVGKAYTFAKKTFLLNFFQLLVEGEEPPRVPSGNADRGERRRLLQMITALRSKLSVKENKYRAYLHKKYGASLGGDLNEQQLTEQLSLLTGLSKNKTELDKFTKYLDELP